MTPLSNVPTQSTPAAPPLPAIPTAAQLEARATAAEREGLRELCAAYRRLALERRVGRLPEPTRGDELCGEVRTVGF